MEGEEGGGGGLSDFAGPPGSQLIVSRTILFPGPVSLVASLSSSCCACHQVLSAGYLLTD